MARTYVGDIVVSYERLNGLTVCSGVTFDGKFVPAKEVSIEHVTSGIGTLTLKINMNRVRMVTEELEDHGECLTD
jgi:hypothetical protein